ncbi:hypothetical protein L202_01062 [Cryptococcus amylolentus CBS 6039]|uniref:Uncharacterized protein n=2 Tax=Cryptococcus amylolentus TaxID=104669 RepID=A0A1E3I4M7_9TREE|nr:hypothetical protein L202_01062 [Cryptococcus amylolentus CBS 6039]ODN82786.1 hypothetical protein L202_01062 [Cryptococcus amylolentus CBS 6039]ODO10457.1 hypothetical protein I350_01052 [Cryptococcus amylolentus CBS 6273]
MDTERQTSPTPSSTHNDIEDEAILVPSETDEILEDFMYQLDTNISRNESLRQYEDLFQTARNSIYSAVQSEVKSTLKAEVASRRREGRTAEGSMKSVEVCPKTVGVDSDLRIQFKGLSVYGEGWSGEQTFFDLSIEP